MDNVPEKKLKIVAGAWEMFWGGVCNDHWVWRLWLQKLCDWEFEFLFFLTVHSAVTWWVVIRVFGSICPVGVAFGQSVRWGVVKLIEG